MPSFPPLGDWANDYQFGWYEAAFYGAIIAVAKAVDVISTWRASQQRREKEAAEQQRQ